MQLSRPSVRLSRHPLIHCVICTPPQSPTELPPSSPSRGPARFRTTAAEEEYVFSAASTAQQQDRMVAVTDEGLTVFAVPGFALKGQAFRSKGCAALCWHSTWQLLAASRPGGIGKASQYVSLHYPPYCYNLLMCFVLACIFLASLSQQCPPKRSRSLGKCHISWFLMLVRRKISVFHTETVELVQAPIGHISDCTGNSNSYHHDPLCIEPAKPVTIAGWSCSRFQAGSFSQSGAATPRT
jgi:hypothetical protein